MWVGDYRFQEASVLFHLVEQTGLAVHFHHSNSVQLSRPSEGPRFAYSQTVCLLRWNEVGVTLTEEAYMSLAEVG